MSTSETAESRLLKVPEVAARLRVSRLTVYRRIWDGTLSAVRVGNSAPSPLRMPADELDAWLFSDAGATTAHDPAERAETPQPGQSSSAAPAGNGTSA
jgi:excisionase family DNA binding protein